MKFLKKFLHSLAESTELRYNTSINATGRTPMYDRYDPTRGLHSEPKVEK